jgi:hypothetical protein
VSRRHLTSVCVTSHDSPADGFAARYAALWPERLGRSHKAHAARVYATQSLTTSPRGSTRSRARPSRTRSRRTSPRTGLTRSSTITPSSTCTPRTGRCDRRSLPPKAVRPDLTRAPQSHVSTYAADGTAVAITSTVNLIFGSLVMDPHTGIILNDEVRARPAGDARRAAHADARAQMDDFSIPGTPNAFGLWPSPYNYPAPFKRCARRRPPLLHPAAHARAQAALVDGADDRRARLGRVRRVPRRVRRLAHLPRRLPGAARPRRRARRPRGRRGRPAARPAASRVRRRGQHDPGGGGGGAAKARA